MTRRTFIGAAAAAAGHLASSAAFGHVASRSSADDLTALSLAEAAARLRSGRATSTELTGACLARIAELNPKLNLFITVLKDAALAQAARLDAEARAGKWRGPLHGIPVALKDLIDTAGVLTTGGSAAFTHRIPSEDATVTARLKAGGAVILGKTNLREFGMSGNAFGMAINPWAFDRYTGGTSTGSGAAVAASACYGALGTDTRGSVRNPASFCSLVGLKATFGLVPTRGIMPAVLSLDVCGPMTRTVKDNALMLQVLAGYDKLDITSADHPKEDYIAALGQPVSGLRLGKVVNQGFFDDLDPEVAAAVQEAIAVLGRMTRGVKETTLPELHDRGWSRELEAEEWTYHEPMFKEFSPRYSPADRRALGRLAAKDGGRVTDYIRAKWALELLRRTIDDAFADCDLMVLPTQRTLPPPISEALPREAPPPGAAAAAPAGNSDNPSNCAAFNWYGIPALTVPCGFSRTGLPIGLMIVGPRFSEGRVLALAHAYEQATAWHRRRPPIARQMHAPISITSRTTRAAT